MNTTKNPLLDIVLKYYNHMLQKDFESMGEYLHENVILVSPMATVSGKEHVHKSAVQFANLLQNIDFREKHANESKVILIYNMHLVEPIGVLRAAAMFAITNRKIERIELFYDSRALIEQKSKIFKNPRG